MTLDFSPEAHDFFLRLSGPERARVHEILEIIVADEPAEDIRVYFEHGHRVGADRNYIIWVRDQGPPWLVTHIQFANGAVRDAWDDQQW